MVAISDETVRLVEDWIDHNRPEVTDGHGREPLIASEQGRTTKGNIRDLIYRLTRPCSTEKECPCGKKGEFASKCEHSVSPHALRRGYVTEALNAGQPKEVTADRVDMTHDILEKHYDKATNLEKMEQRRRHYIDRMNFSDSSDVAVESLTQNLKEEQ
jgi:integrase